jgi:uncharacterized membrane protein
MVPPSDAFGSILWNVGYSLCHQISDRSFQIGGLQLPVCARDTGTYIGFMAVFILFLGLQRYRNGKLPDKAVIAVAAIGMAFYAFDGLSSYLGFRDTTNDIRLLSGLAFGSGVSMILMSAAANVLFKNKITASRRTFTYRDLPIVYLLMGVFILPLAIGGEVPFYYVESTIIIAGLLLMIFLIMLTLVIALTGWEFERSPAMFRGIAAASILEAVLLMVLWTAHHYVSITLL